MADPFQPRFADLVRNYSSTSGTGNFVLGPAVNGFTSFTSAIEAGESFYYSAIGVDKPAEREVGRGTLTANGQVSRDPITGPKTNFTSGTKSIALIAAAEWFERIESSAGGGSAALATRSQLASSSSSQAAMLLAEGGREGLFVFDGSNLSAKVSADPNQGVHVAPVSAPTGASGAWVRKFSGPLNVRWFGAVGDNVANDGPAFLAALAYINAVSVPGPYNNGGPALYVPAGKYYLGANTLDLRTTLRLTGDGVGDAGGAPSYLRWALGTTGIRVQQPNTTGATASQTLDTTKSGAASIIDGLHLEGAFAGAEAEAHGIHLRARATVRDCYIQNFQGDGIHIHCDALGNGGVPVGNANSFLIDKVWAAGCRNGLSTLGGDCNAGTVSGCNFNSNRSLGVDEQSFLGNTYLGLHTAGNAAGAYRTTNPNARNIFIGCYSEGDQPDSEFVAPTLILGGLHGAGISGSGVWLRNEGGFAVTDKLQAGNVTLNDGSHISIGGIAGLGDTYRWTVGTNGLQFSYGGATPLMQFAKPGSAFGNTVYDHGIVFDQLWVGAGNNYRQLGTAVANPNGSTIAANGALLLNAGFGGTTSPFGWMNSGYPTTWSPVYGLGAAAAAIATSGSGADLANASVTLGKVTTVADATILGNNTGSAASPVALTAAQVRALLSLATVATSGSASDLTAGTVPAGRMPAHTGDVTSAAGAVALTIANDAVTYAKMQNVSATARLLGRASAGAGDPEEIGLAGGLAISGSNLTFGAITPTSVAATGAVTSSGGAVGYATGAGGTVTQLTNKSTGVTLNKLSGQVTMNNAALAAAGIVEFTVTDNQVAATDTVNLVLASGATAGTAYRYWISGIAAGSFKVTVENRSGGSLSEALVFSFAVLKAVSA